LADKLSNILAQCNADKAVMSRMQNVIIALAILVYKAPKATVDARMVNVAVLGLLEILDKGGPQQATAIALVGDGFSIWKPFMPDEMDVCKKLFALSLSALTTPAPGTASTASASGAPATAPDASAATAGSAAVAVPNLPPSLSTNAHGESGPTPEDIATDALQAFINVAIANPGLYVEFLNSMVSQAQQVPTQQLAAAITSLYPMMKKAPSTLVGFVVPISAALLKVLDPHVPSIRDVCMHPSTLVLRYMVELFPMVSFHQERQKLAVGSPDGIVIIYDMRTASKWQLFEAHHKKPIAACSLSPQGDMLVTYCPREF
jgi:hypothetical protein